MLEGGLISLAFENAIDVLGERGARMVIEDLHSNGVYLDDSQIRLETLANAIRHMFGDEAAHLICERVLLELDRLCPQSIME